MRISAVIFRERDGQKAILIGKGGAKLREIGTTARYELERLLNKKIFPEIFIKSSHAGGNRRCSSKTWTGGSSWRI